MTTEDGGEKPLRVLHIYRTYFPDTQGGGEEVIRQICLNTRSNGIDCRVFSLSPNAAQKPLKRDEGLVFQAQQHLEVSSCGISLTANKRFRELARWADVLHYHFPWPFGDLLHLINGSVTRKPVVISYHSDVVRQKKLYFFYRPLMTRFLKRVNRIVATSPNYVQSSSLLQKYQHKTAVIPIGLNEDNLPTAPAETVEKYHRQYGEEFFFFVGVFRYYKGLKYLLEAARHTSANIVLAGSGPEESALREFARNHGLTNVHFAGRVSDAEKAGLMAACKAFIFPSHLPSESFGIALLEASMMAKPMISCDIGTGTSWVNLDGETGLVVPPADPQALRQAMDTLLADSDLAFRFGINARQRYQQMFTGKVLGESYATLYREIAAEPPANHH